MTTPADPTLVSPSTFEMSVAETQTLAFNASAYLQAGQTIAGLSASLTEISSGEVTTPASAPSASGSTVSQVITGGTDVQAGGEYRLRIKFTTSPTTNVWVMDLILVVFA